MNRTDTQAQLETLRNGLEPDRPRRLAWVVGGLAVAASVAVAVFLVSNLGDDTPTTLTPAGPVETSPVEVGTGFMEAFAAYDEERAASYLADGTIVQLWWTPPEPWSLAREFGWSAAAGFEMLPGPCEEGPTSGAVVTVVCPFDFHALGSAELDRGPFGDNQFRFTVRDGKITTADVGIPYGSNGFSTQAWEPFAIWITATHPKDGARMYKDWPNQVNQFTDDQGNALWAKYVPKYVAAVRAGTAD